MMDKVYIVMFEHYLSFSSGTNTSDYIFSVHRSLEAAKKAVENHGVYKRMTGWKIQELIGVLAPGLSVSYKLVNGTESLCFRILEHQLRGDE